MLDLDGYIKYANAAATSISGFSKKELVHSHLSIFYHHDPIKTEYELSLAKKEGRFISEGWRPRKDEGRFWGEITITLVKEGDAPIGYSCLLRDITEKKKQEFELRKSEERYRLMVEAVRDYAIFMLDAEGNIVTWNEGAKRLKGYAANEIIGRHFSTF